jgi:hypothetical protein
MANLILRMNVGDSAVDRGTTALQAQTGYAVVTETYLAAHPDEKKLSEIRSGEKLLIHGHGNPRRLGGKGVQEMARLLADHGLKGPVVIELYACKCGMTGAPYALELKVELVQGHKIMCSVMGMKGTLVRSGPVGVGSSWTVKNPSSGVKQSMTSKTTYSTTKAF